MSNTRLTQRQIDALKPRRKTFDVRDTELKGFGVRVRSSGIKRYFVQSQHEEIRTWRMLGDASGMSLEEARCRARSVLASLYNGEEIIAVTKEETRFGVVAEKLFEAYERHWKVSTRKVNRNYLKKQILPWFRNMQVAEITERNVKQWHASLHATPFCADRAAPVLSVLLRQAEVYGYRPEGSNPCVGIRRYRRRGRERFLSPEEMQRLGAVLSRHEPDHPLEAAAIRLLLLTGCRCNEILSLKWSDYREGHLYLRDSKTGPRTVWLSSPARGILDGLPRRGAWIFPARQRRSFFCQTTIQYYWYKVRGEAGLGDVRLHDLRHSYASVALLNGATIPTIARLLGHNDTATTLKYTHLNHTAVRAAVETVAPILAGEA